MCRVWRLRRQDSFKQDNRVRSNLRKRARYRRLLTRRRRRVFSELSENAG